MLSAIANSPCWYVVHTRPRQEDRTDSNLRTLGLEMLNPKLRVNKYNEFTGAPTRVVKPLFPGYIFACFCFSDFYHRIRFTRGVHSVLCFDNQPAPVDDAIIELVRSRVGTDGFVKPADDLKSGDEVRITDGRFRNLCGVFDREMPDADRVRILLNAVSFQAHVVVDRALVTKLTHEVDGDDAEKKGIV